MGFSVTVTHIIFFLAFTGMASAVMGTYWSTSDELQEARRADAERLAEIVQTDLTVTTTSYNNGLDRFTVDIENTGTTTLDHTQFAFLVEGVYIDSADIVSQSVVGEGSTELLMPGDTLQVVIGSITSSPNRFRAISENGVAALWSA